MRPDDQTNHSPETDDQHAPEPKGHHPHERWPVPRKASPIPLAWSSKTMHHPATRIGEMKHGKS